MYLKIEWRPLMGIVVNRSDGLKIRVTGIGVDGDPIGEVIDELGIIITVRRLSVVEKDAYLRAQKSGKPETATIQYRNGVVKTHRYAGVNGRRSRFFAPQRFSLRSDHPVSYRPVELEADYSMRMGSQHYSFSKGLY